LPVVHLWLCIDSQLRALRLFDWPFSPLLERLSTIVPFWIVFGVLGTAWWAVIEPPSRIRDDLTDHRPPRCSQNAEDDPERNDRAQSFEQRRERPVKKPQGT